MIIVNGVSVDQREAKHIDDLLVDLKIESATVVIEQNGIILEKEAWPSTLVKDEDRIEVIRLMGGGCQ